jgi:2'-5' RNA ligase
VDRRNWHVTLVFVGNFPEAQLPFLQSAAAELDPGPIRLRFDRLAYLPRAKVACLLPMTAPPALLSLVGALEITLQTFDRRADERTYRPHITVARRARPFETMQLTRPIDLEWSGFTLVESKTLPTGAVYRPLAHYPV